MKIGMITISCGRSGNQIALLPRCPSIRNLPWSRRKARRVPSWLRIKKVAVLQRICCILLRGSNLYRLEHLVLWRNRNLPLAILKNRFRVELQPQAYNANRKTTRKKKKRLRTQHHTTAARRTTWRTTSTYQIKRPSSTTWRFTMKRCSCRHSTCCP